VPVTNRNGGQNSDWRSHRGKKSNGYRLTGNGILA
jgi:hypothetical protein